MALPRRTFHLLATASLVLGAGCAPPGSTGPVADAAGTEEVQAGGRSGARGDIPSPETTRLLERMELSHARTRYRGLRRVELHFAENGVPRMLEYREDVACDGQGAFAIDVTEVISGEMDHEMFRTLQHGRQVFTFNFRDFQVTDLGLFRQNYEVRVLSNDQVVAGVPCLELRIDRSQSNGRFYRVLVEPQTGLVLCWEFRTDQGALLARSEFETIELDDPDLSNYLLVERNFGGASVDVDLDLGGQVGFPVLTPNLLPSGFELETASTVFGALERTWLKRVYTDGVSRLAFLHRAQEDIDNPADERNLGQVYFAQVGRWSVVSGQLAGWDVIAMGQVEADDLFQMLQSAL